MMTKRKFLEMRHRLAILLNRAHGQGKTNLTWSSRELVKMSKKDYSGFTAIAGDFIKKIKP